MNGQVMRGALALLVVGMCGLQLTRVEAEENAAIPAFNPKKANVVDAKLPKKEFANWNKFGDVVATQFKVEELKVGWNIIQVRDLPPGTNVASGWVTTNPSKVLGASDLIVYTWSVQVHNNGKSCRIYCYCASPFDTQDGAVMLLLGHG